MKNEMILKTVNLYAFDGNLNTNVSTDSGLSAAFDGREFYADYFIDLAGPQLVHDTFAQKHTLPENHGKYIAFRKYAPLPEITTALVEGVTPDGQKIEESTVEAEIKQYGGYATLSDVVSLTNPDKILIYRTELLADQGARSLDVLSREVLVGGTNVRYANGKTARSALAATDKLTVKDVKRAVRDLENMNAKRFSDGYFGGIIHPYVAFDLTEDEQWRAPHQYVDTKEIYKYEIGAIAGVRFLQTSNAKKYAKGGASGADVYATMVIGKDAYGTIDLGGSGLEVITKPLGSGGTSDPLNQRGTHGWKAFKATKILVDEYMVRIESGATAD